jgi:hypothetical protein
MAAIIEFPLGRTRFPGSGGAASHHAEVVIFPGVRIERRDLSVGDRAETKSLSIRQGALQTALED